MTAARTAARVGMMVFLLIGVLGLFVCHAMDVTLQWDANTEPDLAGYKVYYDVDSGDPYVGTGSPVDLPLAQDENPDSALVEYTLRDITDSYIAVTAYDDVGRESDYSNEVYATSTGPSAPEIKIIEIIQTQTQTITTRIVEGE